MANRPRSLIGRHAGVGLDPGSGGTLDIDLNELGAAVVAPSADSIPIITAGGLSKKEAIADLVALIAGTAAATALVGSGGVLTVTPSDALVVLANDSLMIVSAAGVPEKEAIADLIALVAGTASASGLSASAGVLKVAPADAAINVAADSVMFVTSGGVPKKEAVADLATGMADNVGIASSAGVHSIKAAGVTKDKLAGSFSKITFANGTAAATPVTIAGMVVGDELVAVMSFATAAVLATLNNRTSEYTVGAGVLGKAGGTNETGNQLIVFWNDIT